jgi:general secretion pathway protein J
MSGLATRRQSGLTLLEMIVVMFIASMALTLGYQSLQQWRRAQASVSEAGSAASTLRLGEQWWRQAVSGISSRFDLPLTGDNQRFEAHTGIPLLASGGVDVAQTWSLERQSTGWSLDLLEAEQPMQLALPGAVEARFEYLDDNGVVHDRWPPGLGVQAARPQAVVLGWEDVDGRQRVWIARLGADPQPHFPAFELEEY